VILFTDKGFTQPSLTNLVVNQSHKASLKIELWENIGKQLRSG